MANIKEIIEEAHFTIPADYPYEGIICARGKAKHLKHRTRRPLFFTTQDMLVDAVLKQYRATPRVNVWRRKLPMEVIEYCYSQVGKGKMSFVLDFTKNENPDPNMEYLVCIFEERHVKKTPAYQKVFQSVTSKA